MIGVLDASRGRQLRIERSLIQLLHLGHMRDHLFVLIHDHERAVILTDLPQRLNLVLLQL